MEQPAPPPRPLPPLRRPSPRRRPPGRARQMLWQGKIFPAFWTIASSLSLVVNLILIAALLLLGKELFRIKSLVSDQLVGGLHQNFVAMDQAHIRTNIRVQDTIPVENTIPVQFVLGLDQDTVVVTTDDITIPSTTVYLNGTPVRTTIVLPRGAHLPIHLKMDINVDKQIPISIPVPVDLQVPVDIPLSETELHEPFVGLQSVVAPYDSLLQGLPNSWSETPLCGSETDWACAIFFDE